MLLFEVKDVFLVIVLVDSTFNRYAHFKNYDPLNLNCYTSCCDFPLYQLDSAYKFIYSTPFHHYMGHLNQISLMNNPTEVTSN